MHRDGQCECISRCCSRPRWNEGRLSPAHVTSHYAQAIVCDFPCQIAGKNRCMPLLGSCPVLGCVVFRFLGAHFSSLCKVENHGYSDDNEQCGHGRAPLTYPGSACEPELPISDPTFRYSFASSAVREIPRRVPFTQAGKGCRTMKGRSDIAKTF